MEADYVVVGTGSAGSVLANRLSADSGSRVVVLEAGPPDKDKYIHVPAAWGKLFRGALDWDYLTEPQKELNGRQIYWPRGKMLGGSSSMNAMMWARGFAADYEEWANLAGEDWDSAHVEKHFMKIERGPLIISPQRSPCTSTAAWLKAAEQCGYRIEQPNQLEPDGFCETAVTQRRGARWSCADAYLKPVLRRRNLTLHTGATATRVLFKGTRAVGVEFEHSGQRRVVLARREVVLCGGAINSPQLLLLSGIGDREQLAEHGVDVVHHSPQVGRNLIDHLCAPLGFNLKGDNLSTGMASRARRGHPSLPHPRSPAADKPGLIVNYLVRRRGMLTSNGGEAYGYIRSRPDLQLPDLELMFVPAPFFDEGIGDPYEGHAVSMWSILLKPHSRGSITLRSRDPKDKPIIDPQYLTDDAGADRAAIMAGLRGCARIAEAPALRGMIDTIARPLGADKLDDATLDEALNKLSHTVYHPVGTCRMGRDDASVVDPQLRVRGVERLRVADASVMPAIIRGHTHAPSVLIGEKAADLIRA